MYGKCLSTMNMLCSNRFESIFLYKCILGIVYLTTLSANVCENKFEFKNQKHKPTLLEAPSFPSNRVKFAVNRALLTVNSGNMQLLLANNIEYNSHYDHQYKMR